VDRVELSHYNDSFFHYLSTLVFLLLRLVGLTDEGKAAIAERLVKGKKLTLVGEKSSL